jgi:NADH dehydrogenase
MEPSSKSAEKISKKVVIVGGGFGGLTAAKVLGKDPDLRITLLDRRNYHLFQPLLYQVATAGLSPADIAVPIRSTLSAYPNVEVQLAEVDRIDVEARVVHSGAQSWAYDHLILACGARHSYFGHDAWEEHAPGLKTLEQATEIRRRILLAFELAERSTDPEETKRHLTFVVVGGGPTGVELAGAIAEISRTTLESDFRKIDPTRTQVILIEGSPRVLGGFDEELSRKAETDLKNLGVQVRTATRVTNVAVDGVHLGTEFLPASTIIWAAGVLPSPIGRALGVPLDPAGRVIVNADLSIPRHPEVFVIGDQAHANGVDGKPLPGLAPVAMQQARYVARVIREEKRGRTTDSAARGPFRYLDKGQMATIGRKRAVLQFRSLRIGGFLAWFAWLFIHIFYLIGFKNRISVFAQWTWSYLTFKRGARLITEKEWRENPLPAVSASRNSTDRPAHHL